jgi:hypothetical protein
LQTPPDRFSVNFNFPKVFSADKVWRQVRHSALAKLVADAAKLADALDSK